MKEIKIFDCRVLVDESIDESERFTSEITRGMFKQNKLLFIDTETYDTLQIDKLMNINYWQIHKAVRTGYVGAGEDGTKKTKRRFRLRALSSISNIVSVFLGKDLNEYFNYRWLSGRTLAEKIKPMPEKLPKRLTDAEIKDIADSFDTWKTNQNKNQTI
jgi:hypothetical protein